MGRMSRDKGKRGELELVHAYEAYGFETKRNLGQEHAKSEGFDVKTDVRGVNGLHIQSKRAETLSLPAWIKQAMDEAPPGTIPTVHFRRSFPKIPCDWWLALPLSEFLPVVRAWVEAHQ